ncbi:hypothetical protein LCGC14_3090200, partial [marine sediment metagenome]
VEQSVLNSSLAAFTKRLGEAKDGAGGLFSLLKRTQDGRILLKQLNATTDVGVALGLMADEMVKIEDPTKKAAFASAAFSRAGMSMVNLLNQGSDGVDKLKTRHFELAGSQEKGARNAAKMADAMTDVKASMQGVKAEILTALAPAFLEMTTRMTEWFTANRKQIGEWVAAFGEKLPGHINTVKEVFLKLVGALETVVAAVGGLKNALLILGTLMVVKFAISVGMVVSSLVSLAWAAGLAAFAFRGKLLIALRAVGAALLANPILLIAVLLGAAVALIIRDWEYFVEFFKLLWEKVGGYFKTWFNWMKTVFFNFTPLGLLIKHWGPVSEFFESMWDGVVSVFQAAWEK